MGRPERPLDASGGPIAAFAHDLRLLRQRAGNPSYRDLARTALFSPSVLSSAASGRRLPTLAATVAFVSACGGDPAVWEQRWRDVAARIGLAVEPRAERAAAFPAPAEPQPTRPTRPAQLPMGLCTFVGRTWAFGNARSLVGRAGPVRLPMLVGGPIGVGKTAFALRLATEVVGDFPDGQLYADLANLGSERRPAYRIVQAFLEALGIPAAAGPADPAERCCLFRSLLAQRRLFVLMANIRDESQVRPLLGQTRSSQVVLTSRARLLGLDGIHRIDLDTFTREESLTLLGRLAGMARIRAEYRAADAIAELCGDLPLAVNIVGRKIAARPDRSVAYLAGQLADHDRLIDSLGVGDTNVWDRFADAYRSLNPDARQVIRHLGLTAASSVTATELAATLRVGVEPADELIESIVDAGLLRRVNVAGRYRMPTLVRLFAADMRARYRAGLVPLAWVGRESVREPVYAP